VFVIVFVIKPLKAPGDSNVQEFKCSRSDSEQNFHVSRIPETSK
jgi:hypothetical protein